MPMFDQEVRPTCESVQQQQPQQEGWVVIYKRIASNHAVWTWRDEGWANRGLIRGIENSHEMAVAVAVAGWRQVHR